jgi:hypothetical protein
MSGSACADQAGVVPREYNELLALVPWGGGFLVRCLYCGDAHYALVQNPLRLYLFGAGRPAKLGLHRTLL